METIEATKEADREHPIPSSWRPALRQVVNAFRQQDFMLKRGIKGVNAIGDADARRFAENIRAYGATLNELPEEAWETSICRWQDGYWDILVDLFTVEEGASDLVLFARAYERADSYQIEITSVHVP